MSNIRENKKITTPWEFILKKELNYSPKNIENEYVNKKHFKIYDFKTKETLGTYYETSGWDYKWFWHIYNLNLKTFCKEIDICHNDSQFSPSGGFTDNETEAREMVEAVLKYGGYRILDKKYEIIM